MIVEDDSDLADLIALVVAHAGYTPLVAYDGEQALTLARSSPPALLITDLRLPGMSGEMLIATLRAERGATLPILVLSAAPSLQLQAVDADAILAKPFKAGDLLVLLGSLLVT